MNKDEALDLALEALELHGKQYPHMVKGYCLDAITAIKQAIAAPVQEPVEFGMHGEKMMFKVGVQQFTLDYEPDTQEEFNFMREMLIHAFSTFTPDVKTTPPAAPVQPVGLIARLTNPEQYYEFTDPKKANAVLMSLCQEAADALAAPVQEPVAWRYKYKFKDIGETGAYEYHSHAFACVANLPCGEPLYTTPPAAQRPWVGLTDEELDGIYAANGGTRTRKQIAAAIEAKLKEKNT
jgi:hypothetical protein